MNKYIETRFRSKCDKCEEKKCKFDIMAKKENTLRSLREVECFLTDFKRIAKHIKLYKLLR